MLRRWLIALGCIFSPALGLLVPAEAFQTKSDFVSRAVKFSNEGFLKAPAKLEGDFTVAKNAPEVEVCFFSGLEDRGKGTLWSSWGDGCLASGGKYYTSVGDHLGTDANSYVYEYDPMAGVLRRVVDVLIAIAHQAGMFGHGKIHSGIHEGKDGKLYFTTYWGKQREVDAAYDKGYRGSVLLRYDPKTGKTDNLGAIVPKTGLPASNFDPQRQLLFFFSVYKGDVAVYDIAAEKVKFVGGADITTQPHRTFLRSGDGRMFFSGKDGCLHYYDADKNELAGTRLALPANPGAKKGDSLRAAAQRPAKDGTLYGMTSAGKLFSIDLKKEAVKDLGANFAGGDYTAAMVISPDDRYLYYAPGAHGSGSKTGVPVVQYEIASGKRKVLAFLAQPVKEKFDYDLGGTYNLQIDPAGEKLYFTFNGAGKGQRNNFGTPSVVVVHISKQER